MHISLDNTFLSMLLVQGAKARVNPVTGHAPPYLREKIEALIDDCNNAGSRIVVAAPALAEVLAAAPDSQALLARLRETKALEVKSFDLRCAFELAEVNRKLQATGDKRGGVKDPWQKVKFDRQIVMIAKMNGVDKFYTDDEGQGKFAEQVGLKVIGSASLVLPGVRAQMEFSLSDSASVISFPDRGRGAS